MAKSEDQVRQKLVEARRSQILEAAGRVFAEKGYHRATTKEIADAAGISEGTIYNYFSSKEDLLINMLNSFTDPGRWEEQFEDVLHGDFRDSLARFIREVFTRGRVNDQFTPAIISEILINPDLRERYRKQRLEPVSAMLGANLNELIEAGQMRRVEVPYLARIFLGTFLGLQVLRLLGDPVLTPENDAHMAAVLGKVFSDGLAARAEKDKPS